MTSNRPRDEQVADLVAANRILADQQVLDAYGHVSVRDARDAGRYLLSRSRAPEIVEASDIVEYDLDSNALKGDGRAPYLERFIHGEIYRARPDVMAVVHSHAASVLPYACSTVKLRPLFHMAGFLGDGPEVFDIAKLFGPTDLLVKNRDQGAALARTLGGHSVALMRGHGFVAVAGTLPIAVYRAIYTMVNAGLQERAIGLGGSVTYLDPAEAELAQVNIEATIARPWELWKSKALRRP
jgi:ribulose-5-phosphate 4-epimerase/fuculose-1-phosphate aldolase